MAKILIVEDDPSTAEIVKAGLTRAGHACSLEGSGANALEAAKGTGCELVVLDIMLPGGTCGFEVCRRIRRDANLYTIPILVLSAMSGEEEVLHGLAQGADDYVVKPFNVGQLVQRVEALLRANTARQDMDEITSLPGAAATKRELQRRISRQEPFALAYGELVYLREFSRKFGGDARNRAIRHLGRAMQRCGEELAPDRFFVGHMGGGHFVTILPADHAERYCEWVRRIWMAHLDALYQTLGRAVESTEGFQQDGSSRSSLDILFCVTLRESRDTSTPQQIFETLSQIRHKALETHGSGVHLDRRALC